MKLVLDMVITLMLSFLKYEFNEFYYKFEILLNLIILFVFLIQKLMEKTKKSDKTFGWFGCVDLIY